MNALSRTLCLVGLFLIIPMAHLSFCRAQEGVTNVEKPGAFQKFLTETKTDRWVFKGKANQMAIALVNTSEFDAVVSIVQTVESGEKVLKEIDDKGSDAVLKYRLPADGEYKILVRGFENSGGGNYTISLEQIDATPIRIDEAVKGTFDLNRKSNFYFVGTKGSFVALRSQGTGYRKSTIRSANGEELAPWENLFELPEDGEYALELYGERDKPFEFVLQAVKRQPLPDGGEIRNTIAEHGAVVFDVEGSAGLFRLIEIEAEKSFKANVSYDPIESADTTQLEKELGNEPIKFLPISSKGKFARYAVMFGRTARYRVEIASHSGTGFRLSMQNILKPLTTQEPMVSKLPVGSTLFFAVSLEQAKTLVARAVSDTFDPTLELFNELGTSLTSDDDNAGGLNSELRHLSFKNEKAILAVSSVGKGGGGEFKLDLQADSAKQAVMGEKQVSVGGQSGIDHWLIEGKKGESVIVHIQGSQTTPIARLLNSGGDTLVNANQNSIAGTNSVFVFEFPQDGKYTLLVQLSRGQEYKLKAFDPK